MRLYQQNEVDRLVARAREEEREAMDEAMGFLLYAADETNPAAAAAAWAVERPSCRAHYIGMAKSIAGARSSAPRETPA